MVNGETCRRGEDYVDKNGDVQYFQYFPEPPLTDEEWSDILDARVEEQCLIDEGIRAAQLGGNFRRRNQGLLKVVDLAGKSNRDWGAAQLEARGAAGHIVGSKEAANRSLSREQIMHEMADLACRVCPLAEFCDMENQKRIFTESVIKTQKKGMPDSRNRTHRRVAGGGSGRENLTRNNHFCRDVIELKRLPRVN